mgnify:CR=1 FL=1
MFAGVDAPPPSDATASCFYRFASRRLMPFKPEPVLLRDVTVDASEATIAVHSTTRLRRLAVLLAAALVLGWVMFVGTQPSPGNGGLERPVVLAHDSGEDDDDASERRRPEFRKRRDGVVGGMPEGRIPTSPPLPSSDASGNRADRTSRWRKVGRDVARNGNVNDDENDSPAIGGKNSTRQASKDLPFPFRLHSRNLFVALDPDGVREPDIWKVGPLRSATSRRHRVPKSPPVGEPAGDDDDAEARPPRLSTRQHVYAFNDKVKHVILDVGTNMDPDSVTDFWHNDSVGFVWFEPQKTLLTHPLQLPHIQSQMGLAATRVMAYPAAVAPTNGMMVLHLSAVHGCTSLLPMNDHALKDPAVMKGSFIGSDAAFPEYATSRIGFEGCIKKAHATQVPVVTGHDVVSLIDPKLNIIYLSVDAQGFDLQVATSFGLEILSTRIDSMLLECQDLPAGHPMFLTQGSYSCADIRDCVHKHLPHRMINPLTGQPSLSCPINNPSHERNCIFRRLDRPFLGGAKMPYLLARPQYELKHPANPALKCPSFIMTPGDRAYAAAAHQRPREGVVAE